MRTTSNCRFGTLLASRSSGGSPNPTTRGPTQSSSFMMSPVRNLSRMWWDTGWTSAGSTPRRTGSSVWSASVMRGSWRRCLLSRSSSCRRTGLGGLRSVLSRSLTLARPFWRLRGKLWRNRRKMSRRMDSLWGLVIRLGGWKERLTAASIHDIWAFGNPLQHKYWGLVRFIFELGLSYELLNITCCKLAENAKSIIIRLKYWFSLLTRKS